MKGSIELDCSPGFPRPSDLIVSVVAGTALEAVVLPTNANSSIMGNWTWAFELTDEEYAFAKPIIEAHIVRLYEKGLIRYGSW